MSQPLLVVPTGTANVASVFAAFRRIGISPETAADGSEVEKAQRVVLPGVGSFGAAMDELDRAGLRSALAARVAQGRPTLAVCVGMQLLAGSSEESAGTDGLGSLPTHVHRFSDEVRVPQLGWNQVRAGAGCRFVNDGWAYFANSYRMEAAPEGWCAAVTDHGGEFVSALEREDVLACQFHPELSGDWGSRLLARWVEGTGRAA
jgi:imidazole glycerol phosphate synthase glutamine amidotransferase subunit